MLSRPTPTRQLVRPLCCASCVGLPAHNCCSLLAGVARHLQVEVKLRLEGPGAHAKLAAVLAPGRVATHQQENYFFDGPNRELNSRFVVLRVRFYDTDKKAVLTLKVGASEGAGCALRGRGGGG